MADRQAKAVEALLQQSRTTHAWLRELSAADFAAPSVLPGWDVRMLVAHLVLVHAGFVRILGRPSPAAPLPAAELVRRFRRDVDMIAASTAQAAGSRSGAELADRLGAAIEDLAATLTGSLPSVLDSPRGPVALPDLIDTRVVEVVVHSDDLSRSRPERTPIQLIGPAVAVCTRTLAGILAGQQPGRSIEVRIPPYAAVQCGLPGDPGPTHTRGTPPNVVETDPVTFLRLTTGRVDWAGARTSGRVRASGQRADLSPVLPLLS